MRFYIALLFIFSLSVSAQNPYPQDYFHAPMNIPLHTSGTFGELRANHFHAGLDYRTNQKTGYPVFASAEGYVSRIKVSSYGYGTAIYIDHPNGYTTLYGHLLKYAPKIEEYVRKKQYEKKSFEIELFPKQGEITVAQGETIAYSGNTGGSGGPHLHFEIRDTKTEMIINPLLFGLDKKMKDTKPPVVYGVLVYPLSENAVADGSRSPLLVNIKQLADGTYLADKIHAKGKIGFAVNATDKSTGSTPNNGIYKAELFFNGSPHFSCEFNTFAFNESRYVNNYIDYERYYNTGQRFQRLFVQTPYPLSLLKHNQSNGQFEVVQDSTMQNYRIVISDYHGNKTVVNGSIQYSADPATTGEPKHITPYKVKAGSDNNYTKGGVSVFVPANAFYEDFYLDFDVKDSILYLHHPTVPVHSYVQISYDVSGMSKEELAKTFIAGTAGKKLHYNESVMEDGRLTAKVKTLGQFKLMKDVTPPRIYGATFKEGDNLSKRDTLGVKISDDLSGIGTYDAFINGKWALLHYDYKTRNLTYFFSDAITDDGKNELKIVVTDNVGNSTTFETYFYRTQNTNPVENNK
ncbi:M23 family metallopeptidase [Flavobacterium sp. RHBU_3]|uniref:M23 family metallopeptidase n=1 Tax=Flavobacterium sp. RHBU_3 TaxID=3391184 RepID=UPI003984C3F5